MIDEQEAARLRARNAEAPGLIENFSDWCSTQWRGLKRLFRGLPIGIPLAAATVMACVEAYMIASGFGSLMGVWVAYFSGAVLVGAFIWLTHEFFISLETNEPMMEKLGWGTVVLVVFAVVTFSFFATQVNNATFNYDEAHQREIERSSLNNQIAAYELELRTTTVPTWYEADKQALLATQAAGKRWSINSFDDCAPDGGFSRQAQVDICNRWGELNIRLAESESLIARIEVVQNLLDEAKKELALKPRIQGDAAWDAIAKLQHQEVSQARAITLAMISAFMIWITAFIWHKLIKHFVRQRKLEGNTP